MVSMLLAWLAEYGYPVVFLAATLENVFPVGFLVPGEIIVLSAAVSSGATDLDPVIVAVLAAVGETLGEVVSFALGRAVGPSFTGWISRRFPRTAEPLQRATAYFRERGGWALVLGRPAWGIKATLPVVAGMSDMPPWKVIALVTLSSLYYYPTLVTVAYLFGLGLGTLAETSRAISIVAAVLLTLLVIGMWAVHRARQRRAE